MNPRLVPANKPCSQTAKFLLRSTLPVRKPFCKVCQDAGKPESDYTSHYVRSLPDKQGNTTILCPTLLSTECRYCYELGHTAKFCPVLEARKKADERKHREDERRVTQQQPVQKPKEERKGGFSALMDLDDEVEPTPVVEDFPALGAPSQRVVTGNYASAAAKPVPVAALQKQNLALPSGFQVLQKGATYEKTNTEKTTYTRVNTWLDDDSDDDEVEDNSAWD